MTVAESETAGTTASTQAEAGTAPIAPPACRRRKWLVRGASYLALAYAAWCTGMYFFQDGLLFPCQLAPKPVAKVPAYVQELSIPTQDGHSVPGWFVPARSASPEHPAPAVLFFHGNAEIIDYENRVESLWGSLGASILFAEYRGYGRARAAGEPSEAALVADGVRFFDELCKRPDVDRSRIIIHGYSIGGGVAAQVAAQRKPAALILEATFTSVADFAWGYGVPPFLARHPFRTDEALARIGVPIFIAHGRADTIVPVEHGRRLHALVPTSTYIELNCGHLDLPGAGAEENYRTEIRGFLKRSMNE